MFHAVLVGRLAADTGAVTLLVLYLELFNFFMGKKKYKHSKCYLEPKERPNADLVIRKNYDLTRHHSITIGKWRILFLNLRLRSFLF